MPCNTDYMEPTHEEIKYSQVMCIHDYLFKKMPINKTHWNGYHPKIYSQSYDKYVIPNGATINRVKQRIVELFIMRPGITKKMPLEIQIWWRDERDRRMEVKKKAKEELKKNKIIKQALDKLTDEEKEALGLKKKKC